MWITRDLPDTRWSLSNQKRVRSERADFVIEEKFLFQFHGDTVLLASEKLLTSGVTWTIAVFQYPSWRRLLARLWSE